MQAKKSPQKACITTFLIQFDIALLHQIENKIRLVVQSFDILTEKHYKLFSFRGGGCRKVVFKFVVYLKRNSSKKFKLLKMI